MKWLPTLASLLLLGTIGSGCAIENQTSSASSSEQNLSQKVPRMESVSNALQQIHFTIKQPSKLPFPVTDHFACVNVVDEHSKEIQITYLNKPAKEYIQLTATNTLTPLSNIYGIHEQMTRLRNGTEAKYTSNGTVSQLHWTEENISYSLTSSKETAPKRGIPLLTLQELVQLADSLRFNRQPEAQVTHFPSS